MPCTTVDVVTGCVEGEERCVDSDLYRCINGEMVLIERNSIKCAKPWLKPEYLILGLAAVAVVGIAYGLSKSE